jgi:hypothetical protein
VSARDELIEAAARESARVYGQLCPESTRESRLNRRRLADREPSVAEQVSELWWLGASDAEIAFAVGVPKHRVSLMTRHLRCAS